MYSVCSSMVQSSCYSKHCPRTSLPLKLNHPRRMACAGVRNYHLWFCLRAVKVAMCCRFLRVFFKNSSWPPSLTALNEASTATCGALSGYCRRVMLHAGSHASRLVAGADLAPLIEASSNSGLAYADVSTVAVDPLQLVYSSGSPVG
ncbi:hypothetical protein MRX96_021552 [Rhipicephalus microplus]